MLLISFRIANKVEVFTLASSPALNASISTALPLSSISTFNLSFVTTNCKLNLPSDNSAKYSFVSSSKSFTKFSILYASNPFVLNAFLSISILANLSFTLF